MEEKSQKTLDELNKKLADSEKSIKNAKNSKNDANTKLAIQKEELKKAEKAEEEAAKALEKAKKTKADVQKKIADSEEFIKKTTESIKSAEEDNKKISADVAAAKKENESFKTAKTEAQDALNQAKKSLVEAEDLLAKAEASAEEAEQIVEEAKISEEVEIQNAESQAKQKTDKISADAKLREAKHEAYIASEDEKYANAEAGELEKVQTAAMKAEKDAVDMKNKAEADAKKLLDDAKKKESDIKNKISELKTEQAERVVARKEAAKQAKADAEEKKKKDLSAIDKAEADVKKQLDDIKSKASAAAKVLEKAIKREEEYRKQEELLKEGKIEEAANVITQDEEATMAASISEAVAARRKSLPVEAKYLYKYLGVEPAGAQIVNVLQTLKVDPKRSKNIVILGQHGFGLTAIGEDFAKFYYDMGICKSEAKAKVKAKVINSGKLAGAVAKLKGGCLIIESAGLITPDRFKEMVDMCAPDKNDIKIILTGEKTALSNMLATNMTQARSFNNRIYFDQINENGMVNVAECYADEKGFKLESGADSAIKNLLMGMESGNVDRLLGAMDDAMKKAETRDPIDKKILKKELVQ